MKNLNLFLFATSLFLLTGCDDCPPCPKDQKLPDCIKNSIPYDVGDKMLFRSSLDDTLEFVCTNRAFFQNEHLPALISSECCPRYESENLTVNFVSGDKTIDMTSDYIVDPNGDYYYLRIDLFISYDNRRAVFYACRNIDYTTPKVALAGRTFQNVVGIDLFSPNDLDSLYLNDNGRYGIVGFIIDGLEWAKIE